MNQREKFLAAGVGAVVLLFVGQSFISSIQSGLNAKKQKIEDLTKTKQNQQLEMTAGLVASQKLNIVAERSLPRSEEKARADYMEWLIELAETTNLEDPIPKFLGESKDKDTYQSFKFQLMGTGTIENVTGLLHAFYNKNYLHRITQFDIRPVTTGNDPNRLSITLNSEVLALGVAKEKQLPPTSPSNRLVKSLDEYDRIIVDRNLFSPLNVPPKLEPNKVVDAKIGLKLELSVDAKDPDPNQYVTYELFGDVPKGILIDKDSGKLSWSPSELGEFQVAVKATDSGIPAQSSLQSLTIKVKELPTPPPAPKNFDVASQSVVTALISGANGPEAWVLSKTEDKKYYLRKGDQLKLGGVEGKVIEVGANYMELETDGKRWTVGLDESLAEAYARGLAD
jgi:hypothetical protein